MGTWDRGSQWCNLLLWINVILRGRFLFWERESEKGREVIREGELSKKSEGQGAGRLFWLTTDLYKHAQPPQIGILLPKTVRYPPPLSLESGRGLQSKGEKPRC